MRRYCWAWMLGLLLVGCGQKPAPDAVPPVTPSSPPAPTEPTTPDPSGKEILFITNASSDFWNAVDTGMKDAGAEIGVPVRMERNDGTVEGQIRLLETAMSQKDEIGGIAVSVYQADATGISDQMKALVDAGIPVICVDSDGAKETRAAFVGTNNLEAGRELGKKAAELMPDGAKYCTFVGTTSAQNAKDRGDGFQEGAGDKFELVETYQDDVDFNRARSNVETALSAHPDVTLLVGLWSYNGPIIAEVVKQAGKADQVQVICFDAAENLIPMIEAGEVKASAVQNPYMMGYQGVLLLKALMDGDDAKKTELLGDGDVHDTGIRIVTPETFGEFKAFMDEKGLKSS